MQPVTGSLVTIRVTHVVAQGAGRFTCVGVLYRIFVSPPSNETQSNGVGGGVPHGTMVNPDVPRTFTLSVCDCRPLPQLVVTAMGKQASGMFMFAVMVNPQQAFACAFACGANAEIASTHTAVQIESNNALFIGIAPERR